MDTLPEDREVTLVPLELLAQNLVALGHGLECFGSSAPASR